MSVVLISDTNIWIDFGHAGLLEKLFQLPYEFHTTDFVVSELLDDSCKQLIGLGLRVNTLAGEELRELYELAGSKRNPSIEDLSCYYLARKTGHPLLTGDMKLREACEADGIVVRGALWLLDMLVDHQILPPKEAIKALEKILDCSGRLPQAECQKRLLAWECAK